MPDPVIVLDQLRKTYGQTVAVEGISMVIPRGEIFGFLGANGAGKTTTIRMLCGLARPTSGTASLAGLDVWRDRYRVRSQFGYVAQRFSLYPDLTVAENLQFFGGACRVPHRQLAGRIDALLAQTDLVAKRHALASGLSGGMKQLLALACALVHEPPILFLDEPTAGLDPVHRQQIWDLLYHLSEGGTTVFVTTHYMDEAERCTQIGFLSAGRLLARAEPRALKGSFATRLLELQVEPVMPALPLVRAARGVLGVALRSGRLRVYAEDPEGLIAAWRLEWPFAGVVYQGHHWAEPDMEDVFSAYSQGFTAILREPATSRETVPA